MTGLNYFSTVVNLFIVFFQKSRAVMKTHNIRRHCETMYGDKYDTYKAILRRKVKKLRLSLLK